MIFQNKAAASVTAKVGGDTKTITLDGVNYQETDPENAAAQINKLLNIVDKAVVANGMYMTMKKEAVNNG